MHTPPRRIIVFVAIVVLAALGVGTYWLYENHINNDSDVVVAQLSAATGLKVSFHPRHVEEGDDTVYHAFVVTSQQAGELRLDAHLTFVSQDQQLFNYTIVDNRGYLSIQDATTGQVLSSGCMNPNQFPPLYEIEQALRAGTVIDALDATGDRNGCPTTHKLIEVVFAGEPYTYCSSSNRTENLLQGIQGDDADAGVEYLTDLTWDDFPHADLVQSCEQQDPGQRWERSLRERMVSTLSQWKRVLLAQPRQGTASSNDTPQCGLEEMKECIFIHGAGNPNEGPTDDAFPDYWGRHINNAGPCCRSRHFIHMDTVTNPWYSPVLSRQVCDTARNITQSGDVIEHAILITHSMGNLILSNAIATGECTIGESSRWVSSQGPLMGSISSDRLQNLCFGNAPYSPLIGILGLAFFSTIGRCPPSPAHLSLAVPQGNYSDTGLNTHYHDAQMAFRDNVDAAICGVSSFGLLTKYSVPLHLVSLLSVHMSQDDGLVEFDSCRGTLRQNFGGHYLDKFYRAEINHADGTFINGDGLWGASRRPIKWFNHLF